jgi:hypothetical protein
VLLRRRIAGEEGTSFSEHLIKTDIAYNVLESCRRANEIWAHGARWGNGRG